MEILLSWRLTSMKMHIPSKGMQKKFDIFSDG